MAQLEQRDPRIVEAECERDMHYYWTWLIAFIAITIGGSISGYQCIKVYQERMVKTEAAEIELQCWKYKSLLPR